MSVLTCPHCGNTTPDITGHEVSGVYDGVLFWTCDKCLRAWSRDWTGFGRRKELADTYVQQWNDHAEAVEAAFDNPVETFPGTDIATSPDGHFRRRAQRARVEGTS